MLKEEICEEEYKESSVVATFFFGGEGVEKEGGKEQREYRGEFGKCAHVSSGSQLGGKDCPPP